MLVALSASMKQQKLSSTQLFLPLLQSLYLSLILSDHEDKDSSETDSNLIRWLDILVQLNFMHKQFEDSDSDQQTNLQVQSILSAIDQKLEEKRDQIKNVKLLEG